MSKKIKVGIIGAGGIVRSCHLNPGWFADPDVELVAIADIDEARVNTMAKDFNIPKAFTDYRDVIAIPEIDIVDVCTPNRFHAGPTIAALKAGKHVICEKPLATTTKEVRQMQDAAKKAKRLLMTAHHQRFHGISRACKAFAEAGQLGDVYHARVNAVRRNWLPSAPGFIDIQRSGGGPMMDIGVHALDLAMWLMDFPQPVRVSGRLSVNFAKGRDIPPGWGDWNRDMFSVEDHGIGSVHFANGATMFIEASWLQHQKEPEDMSNRLFGTKASLTWPSGEYSSVINGALVDGVLKAIPDNFPPHTRELLAFLEAVRTRGASPVPADQSLKVITILEAIAISSKTGREVKITPAKA